MTALARAATGGCHSHHLRSLMSLTGKQKSFVSFYLGEACFNASLAAKLAGYRASSRHSFESIGSENLTRPGIGAAIDEYFKQSHVSPEEVLRELAILARGNSKDKIRALALLSQHHGLLDSAQWRHTASGPVQINVVYEQELDKNIDEELVEYRAQVETDITELNRKGHLVYEQAKSKFVDKPDVLAFCAYYEALLKGGQPPEEEKPPVEVEIIPPSRRLQPAAVERILRSYEAVVLEVAALREHDCDPGDVAQIDVEVRKTIKHKSDAPEGASKSAQSAVSVPGRFESD